MLRPFQVSVGRDGLCCAGWGMQRVLLFTEGRLSNSGNLSSPSEISSRYLQAKQAAEVSAGMRSHLLPHHFLQTTHLGRAEHDVFNEKVLSLLTHQRAPNSIYHRGSKGQRPS